jgi:hypothetical protein
VVDEYEGFVAVGASTNISVASTVLLALILFVKVVVEEVEVTGGTNAKLLGTDVDNSKSNP